MAMTLALLLSGCASPPHEPASDSVQQVWSGRLALNIASEPPQNTQAGFELTGSARAGTLVLNGPLGTVAATLHWAPGVATLQKAGADMQHSTSLEQLTVMATGTSLPVGAMFDWLAGLKTPVAGWQVNQENLGEGRLLLQRTNPEPRARLLIVLDSPPDR